MRFLRCVQALYGKKNFGHCSVNQAKHSRMCLLKVNFSIWRKNIQTCWSPCRVHIVSNARAFLKTKLLISFKTYISFIKNSRSITYNNHFFLAGEERGGWGGCLIFTITIYCDSHYMYRTTLTCTNCKLCPWM